MRIIIAVSSIKKELL